MNKYFKFQLVYTKIHITSLDMMCIWFTMNILGAVVMWRLTKIFTSCTHIFSSFAQMGFCLRDMHIVVSNSTPNKWPQNYLEVLALGSGHVIIKWLHSSFYLAGKNK